MRKILLIFISCISLSIHSAETDVERKINILNQSAKDSLGISLSALSYLMTASPTSYKPKWAVERFGESQLISELEKAGYISVSEHHGLPDGKNSEEIYVRIIPLKTGKEVQRCLQSIK